MLLTDNINIGLDNKIYSRNLAATKTSSTAGNKTQNISALGNYTHYGSPQYCNSSNTYYSLKSYYCTTSYPSV